MEDGSSNKKAVSQSKRKQKARHCLWIDYRSIKLDGRTTIKRKIDEIKGALIEHNGGASFVEELHFENLAFDIIKKRMYDCGIIKQESFGSRDHSEALSRSIDRRLRQIGFKPKKKQESLEDYVKKTYGGDSK
ncbi:MAG: hypothetical protein L7F78_23940 [Syntrophales bacterium LBB04]|nr:hypothetical protein [Syntrophales bacterium LBB04]